MITVNDRAYPFCAGITLLELLLEDAVDIYNGVLVTVNGKLVGKDRYKETLLNDGDEVLVMRVVSGG